jgi:hypothetical protein
VLGFIWWRKRSTNKRHKGSYGLNRERLKGRNGEVISGLEPILLVNGFMSYNRPNIWLPSLLRHLPAPNPRPAKQNRKFRKANLKPTNRK